MARLLVIDDDPALRKACVRLLTGDGHQVAEAEDGPTGAAELRAGRFDAVVSDLTLPGMSGLDVLRAIRHADPGVPIVVITGNPTVDSAAGSIEFGVYRYLPKPFEPDRLREAVRGAALTRLTERTQEPLSTAGAALEARFERAVSGLWLAVQPVVDVNQREVVAYEALMRTTEDSLRRPDELIGTALSLGRFKELARAVRRAAAAIAPQVPHPAMLFVNIHPSELLDDELFSDADLGSQAHRVVIEITERESLSDVPDLRARIDTLRSKGFRIAIDDLGEGYAGLSAVAMLEPDVIKLDMSLVRGVDGSPTKRSLVRALNAMCVGLDRKLIAEGVETVSERQALSEVGVAWMQGYLFARPGKSFVRPEI